MSIALKISLHSILLARVSDIVYNLYVLFKIYNYLSHAMKMLDILEYV